MYTFCMPQLTDAERRFLTSVSKLAYCNPFLQERTDFERACLGSDYVPRQTLWSASAADPDAANPNVARLHTKLQRLIDKARDSADPAVYEDSVHHLLYLRYYPQFVAARDNWTFYRTFAADWEAFFETAADAPHFFACFRQVQRAFHHIFDNIIGDSMPAARLRASVWQSILTRTVSGQAF